jgi:hypothetical protein
MAPKKCPWVWKWTVRVLVEDLNAELTTEELRDLHMEQQQEVAEELFRGREGRQ